MFVRARSKTGPAIERAFSAPLARIAAVPVGSAASSANRSWMGRNVSTTASATAVFKSP